MRYRVEVSDQAHEQLSRFPRDVQERMKRAIDELEANDDSQWSNVKALQGAQWKGRFRKRRRVPDHFQEIPRPRRRSNISRHHQIQRHLSVTARHHA